MKANKLHASEAGIDLRERIADGGTEEHESRDNNDGNQNEKQSILNKTLSFFLGWEQHGLSPFFWISWEGFPKMVLILLRLPEKENAIPVLINFRNVSRKNTIVTLKIGQFCLEISRGGVSVVKLKRSWKRR